MPITFGVEEELLVVERLHGQPVAAGESVVRRARRLAGSAKRRLLAAAPSGGSAEA